MMTYSSIDFNSCYCYVDPTGKIRTMQINDDQVGRSVEETLRLLKAFQFADSHEGNEFNAIRRVKQFNQ